MLFGYRSGLIDKAIVVVIVIVVVISLGYKMTGDITIIIISISDKRRICCSLSWDRATWNLS